MESDTIRTVLNLISGLGLISKQLQRGHLTDSKARGRIVTALEQARSDLIKQEADDGLKKLEASND